MAWLTALLAFATTMLVFSTIVATFVELIHRLLKMRRKGLGIMLESFYVEVLHERLDLATDAGKAEDFAKHIMQAKGVSRLSPPSALASEDHENKRANSKGAKGIISGFLERWLDAGVSNNVPVEVFTQRLVESQWVYTLDVHTDEIIQDIAQMYEMYSAWASEYFERRARLFSVLIALFVAFSFYVNPYHVMTTYLDDASLAQAVSNTSSSVYSDYRLVVELSRDEDPEVFKKLLNDFKPETAGVGAVSSDSKKSTGDKVGIGQSSAQERMLDQLKEAGAPIGWPDQADVHTQCGAQETKGAQGFCNTDIFGKTFVRPTIGNLVWLLIGGLLIGLGAPFWARMVSNLSGLKELTSKISNVMGHDKAPESVLSRNASRSGGGAVLETIALHDKDRGLVSSRNYPLPVATYRTALVAKNAANSAANARKTKEANLGNVGGSEENGLE